MATPSSGAVASYHDPRGTPLLLANPLDRYRIDSPTLPALNPDGSLTPYLQQESPGPEEESNWLPAPDGPVSLVMRPYGPKPGVLDRTWKVPALRPGPLRRRPRGARAPFSDRRRPAAGERAAQAPAV
jgi:Protein of unknown function (DUF1214)